ncbi:MAG: ATP-binding protein [Gemmatimonadaceae bacterium]|nr:ATP-binding protein [Gemmatimonadaceae bacterium]
MTSVINVPQSLDEQTFEQVFEQLALVPDGQKILVDARHTRWSSPYGLTALLCVAQSRPDRMAFAVPEHPDTASYWSRAGFFRHAADVYELHGTVPRARDGHASDVLLEITPIVQTDDVHGVVGRIQQRAGDILHGQLGLDTAVTGRFSMTLSESCQNIVEHAGQGGWVAVQAYSYKKRLGRKIVVIAVCDAGIGFRKSLESSPGHRARDRWDDAMALEDGVLRATSRFKHTDKGRGQGLAGIRRFISQWDGKLSVRSGTARLAITPPWDEDVPLTESMPLFPGTQMQITIPERLGEPLPPKATSTRPRPRGREL